MGIKRVRAALSVIRVQQKASHRDVIEQLEPRIVLSGVSFASPANFNLGFPEPDSSVVADFNGDGKPDLAVATDPDGGSFSAIKILLGNGHGGYQLTRGTTLAGEQSIAIAAGDLNGDGIADLAIANRLDNNVSLLIGVGDASFKPQATYNVGSLPVGIAIADFNSDGKPDIATANLAGSSLSILLNHGDGTFGAKTNIATRANPYAVVAGDFDGDGKMDLAVAGYVDNSVSMLRGNGDGTFQARTDLISSAPRTTSPTDFFGAIRAADLNGDGKLDLAYVNLGLSGSLTDGGLVQVLINNGNGTFANVATYDVISDPASLAIGDFNGDGKPDLAVVGFDHREFTDSQNQFTFTDTGGGANILLNRGGGTFSVSAKYPLSETAAVTAVDSDSDGITDLQILNTSEALSVMKGNGDGTFIGLQNYPAASAAFGPASADLNGDGKPDLIVADRDASSASVFINASNGTFLPRVDYPAGPFPFAVTAGDFNHDNKIDFAVAANVSLLGVTDGVVSIFLNSGNGTFAPKVDYRVVAAPETIAVGDFDHDGNPDLVAASGTDGIVTVLFGRADGTFANRTDLPVAAGDPRGLIFATTAVDANHDGTIDIVTNRSVLFGNGDGTFAAPDETLSAQIVADVNKDNIVDLLAPSGVRLGTPGGAFGPLIGNANTALSLGAVADFNGDGKADIAAAGSLQLGNGDGTFQPPILLATSLDPDDILAADFNGDGKPDLAITHNSGQSVAVILNTTTPATPASLESTAPTSSVLALAPVIKETTFSVSWTGVDNDGGSGISRFTIFVSDNGGAFTPWLISTPLTSANFTGINGHTYRFYSVALDNDANIESKSPVAEAQTMINKPLISETGNGNLSAPDATLGKIALKLPKPVAGAIIGGSPVTVSTQFQNNGKSTYTGAATINFYLSSDKTPSIDDILLGSTTTKKLSLGSKASVPVSFTTTLPVKISGSRFIVAYALPPTKFPERTTLNNTAASTAFKIAPGFINLTAVSLKLGKKSLGAPAAALVIKNNGNFPFNSSIPIDLRFQAHGADIPTHFEGATPLLKLAPGATATVLLRYDPDTLKTGAPGSLTAQIDPDATLGETNTRDNSISMSIPK